jgi:beta-galactosidase
MSSGYESGGFGLINLDGTTTERAKLAGSIARVVDRHQGLFLAARPPRAEIAIVYNPLAHFVGGRQRATAYGGPQGEVAGIERDSLLGAYRALFPTNVPIDYVHINHLGEGRLNQYRLVILPYPPMLPHSSAAAIRDYVASGGALVTEARLGWNNERGYASERVPGLGLWEVVGARETAIETAPGGRTTIVWNSSELPGLDIGDRLAARWYKETLEPTSPDARVVGRFEDGSAAAVMSTYGRGKTLMLGSYVSAAYQSAPGAAVERFYRALLDWAGVKPPVTVAPATSGRGESKGPAFEARYLESGDDAVLVVFNHGTQAAAADVSLRRPAGDYAAHDIVNDRPVPLTRAGDRVSARVALGAADVQVLHLTRK